MKTAFKTLLTEQDLRRIIREEVRAVLSGEDQQIGGNSEEGFIDVNQAAEFLKTKPGTIYQQVHKKIIPFHKPGGRVLFKKSELAEWVRGENKPGGPNN